MQIGHVRRWSTVPRCIMFVAKQLNPETKKPDNERSERRDPRQWTRRRKARQNFRDRRLSSDFSVDVENCVCDTQSCRDACLSPPWIGKKNLIVNSLWPIVLLEHSRSCSGFASSFRLWEANWETERIGSDEESCLARMLQGARCTFVAATSQECEQ